MLVPTGRGRSLTEQTISAEEYEQTLTGLIKRKDEFPLPIKATCAPHYYRILRELAQQEGKEITPKTHGLDAMTRGCLGGTGFCFISHRGRVQPCGYLEIEAGHVRQETFKTIWENSPVFQPCAINRSTRASAGSVNIFGFAGDAGPALMRLLEIIWPKSPCAATGPNAKWAPRFLVSPSAKTAAKYKMDRIDREIINEIQSHFPLRSRPFREVGKKLHLSEKEVLLRVSRLKNEGIIRRIGANFNSRRLGFTSTLSRRQGTER